MADVIREVPKKYASASDFERPPGTLRAHESVPGAECTPFDSRLPPPHKIPDSAVGDAGEKARSQRSPSPGPVSETDVDDASGGGRRRKKSKTSRSKKEKRRKKKKKSSSRKSTSETREGRAQRKRPTGVDDQLSKKSRRDGPAERQREGLPPAAPGPAAASGYSSSSTQPQGGGGDGGGVGGDAGGAAKAAKARSMVPMRPEEYAAQQRTVREVSGRACPTRWPSRGGIVDVHPAGRFVGVHGKECRMLGGKEHRVGFALPCFSGLLESLLGSFPLTFQNVRIVGRKIRSMVGQACDIIMCTLQGRRPTPAPSGYCTDAVGTLSAVDRLGSTVLAARPLLRWGLMNSPVSRRHIPAGTLRS